MKIQEEVMKKIAAILEDGEKEQVYVSYNLSGSCVYFSSKSSSNLLCVRKHMSDYSITNVELRRKRQGTFSKVIKELKEVADGEGKIVIITNVVTEEMSNFCCKNKLKKIENEMSEIMPSYIV